LNPETPCDFLIPKNSRKNHYLLEQQIQEAHDSLCLVVSLFTASGSQQLNDTYLIPVHNASYKGADESGTSLGTRNGLGDTENKRQVASDSFLFQHLSRADTLPRRGHLDEDAALVHAHFLVHVNEPAGFCDCGLGIKAKPGVHLGADISRNNFSNFDSKVDRKLVLHESEEVKE
jgi:hypothetical protein